MIKYAMILICLWLPLQAGKNRISKKQRNAIFMAQSRAEAEYCSWDRDGVAQKIYANKVQQYRLSKPEDKEPSCVESALFAGAVVGSSSVVGLVVYQLYNAL